MTFSGRVLAVVVCAGLLGLAFWDGGYGQAAFGWSALLGLWACALVALWPSDLRVGREPALMVGLVSCLVVWTALSAFWSFSRPATALEVERSLMYLGWLGALLLVLRREWWETVLLTVVSAASAVAVFALVQYLFWSPGVDVTQGRLLFRPIGYANALGGLVALPIPVLVATAAGATHVRFRRLAAALLVPVAVALYLTHSRAAWLGVVVGTLYWLVHSRPGAKLGSVGIAVALPVLSVCVVALLHLTSSGSEGRRLLSAVVVLVGAVAAALAPHRPIVDESVRLRRTVIGLGVV